MSLLRARCPDCRTLTAVAVDDGYECHSCGRSFRAGLVRVPRAWGDGGEPMVEAASLALDYPEVAVVQEETLAMQTLAVASDLAARPLVLGGCCCAHVGAVEGLAARLGHVAVLWLDAHGDLNTPETSPSGNEWGMPLRVLLDRGTVAAADVVLWERATSIRPKRSTSRRPASGTTRARCSTAQRPSTSLSTATCSTPASWRSSCPSPVGRRSARSSGCWPTCGRAASSWAPASRVSRPIPRTSRSSSASPRRSAT